MNIEIILLQARLTKVNKSMLTFFAFNVMVNLSPLNIFGTASSPHISCNSSIKHSCPKHNYVLKNYHQGKKNKFFFSTLLCNNRKTT